MVDLSLFETPHDVDLSLSLFPGASEAEERRNCGALGNVRHPSSGRASNSGTAWPGALTVFPCLHDQRSTASGRDRIWNDWSSLLALCRCLAGRVTDPAGLWRLHSSLSLVRVIAFFKLRCADKGRLEKHPSSADNLQRSMKTTIEGPSPIS